MSYSDLVNIDDFAKRENFEEERWDVSFYCKDCKKIAETSRPKANWYIFVCTECEGKNIAVWTLQWLKSNYKIK